MCFDRELVGISYWSMYDSYFFRVNTDRTQRALVKPSGSFREQS